MQKKTVLIFDSGLGGLSICEHLKCFAELDLLYLSDSEAFPYGDKSEETLIARVDQVINCVLSQYTVDAIVIACNTASTLVLPSLREKVSIPIVGVVPAIKTAAQLSQSGVFGLLATPGTVKRDYTQSLIDEFANHCTVIKVGSSKLVTTIESSMHGQALDHKLIQQLIEQFEQHPASAKLDTMVLGCTHFPLISNVFEKLRPNWRWLDSGKAIAARVQSILDLQQANAKAPVTQHNNKLLFSKMPTQKPLPEYIQGLGFSVIDSL